MKQNDVFYLIPKDKFDTSTIPDLMQLSEKEIKPILPKLLEWTEDVNWPIAQHVIDILVKFPKSLYPLLKHALQPDYQDDIHKYHIINTILPKLPLETQDQLIEDVTRISQYPTQSEKIEGVDEEANDYLLVYSQK